MLSTLTIARVIKMIFVTILVGLSLFLAGCALDGVGTTYALGEINKHNSSGEKAASSEYYKVSVTRVDQDLYKDRLSGLYIETQYCYEYAYGEEALLKYRQYSYDNKLIFDNTNNSCTVKSIFK